MMMNQCLNGSRTKNRCDSIDCYYLYFIMSETPKFDLSRIKLTNGMAKFKTNEIALPKNNFSDTTKADKVTGQKTETPDTAKADKITGQKAETPDTTKADKITGQETETPDTAKADKVIGQKAETPDTAKADKVIGQKAETPDTAKVDKVAIQKAETPDTAKADKVASQKIETPETAKADKPASQTTKLSNTDQKNIAESAKEIQKLLAPLQATYPTKSAYEKQVFVNKFREEIRKNFRVQELLTSGGVELIKILCEPLDIPVEMGEKWLKTAQNCR
ncbi:pentapeptide repeat protein [Calothrix parasitica NIES-267]|uniref:Pentapeptide repeat protein n=1 Tax=Calothrix parasitica NIES-267 TaxID=1973488 RepID=A0A1Z4LZJ0_9CYAN|nr:pentapeptide repeat protein [Calothrix parasitica NIES-267]